MYLCMYVCMYVCMYIYIFFTDQDPQVYVCMFVCMYVCMSVGTSHDHDQPAHLRVKEELQHVPSGAADPRGNK